MSEVRDQGPELSPRPAANDDARSLRRQIDAAPGTLSSPGSARAPRAGAGDSPATLNGSSATVALVDMQVPELTAAHAMLDRMAGTHDHGYTTCRLLQGVVLIEIKRRLDHGKYGAWLKANFDKSQDAAERYVSAAEDFLTQLQDPKFRTRAEFDLKTGVDLLRQDLGRTLRQLEQSRLDLSNPMVQAAALYAAGRSFTQLLLDLKTGRGGRRKREKPLDKTPEEIAHEEAQTFWFPVQEKCFELLTGAPKKALLWLPITAAPEEASLVTLEHQLGALHALVKEALTQRKRTAKSA